MRYVIMQAVKVLPDPVANTITARRLPSLKDFSKFVNASN